MKKLIALFLVLLLLALPGRALAQGADSGFTVRLTRDFGYGGFSNDIQGLFTFHVNAAPDDLVSVEYYIDDQRIATVDEAPFDYQFDTDNFDPGEHELYAIGYDSGGESYRSNSFVRVFLAADEIGGRMVGIIGPILGLIAIAIVLSLAVPMFFNRGQKPTVGDYGVAGGAVCKNCGLPFSRAVWMPNMVVGKLARCPHCGKIAIVARATPAQLEEAEARYRAQEEGQGMAASGESEEERLRRQIDESRYD